MHQMPQQQLSYLSHGLQRTHRKKYTLIVDIKISALTLTQIKHLPPERDGRQINVVTWINPRVRPLVIPPSGAMKAPLEPAAKGETAF